MSDKKSDRKKVRKAIPKRKQMNSTTSKISGVGGNPNNFGQNTATIADTEAKYQEMWVNDVLPNVP